MTHFTDTKVLRDVSVQVWQYPTNVRQPTFILVRCPGPSSGYWSHRFSTVTACQPSSSLHWGLTVLKYSISEQPVFLDRQSPPLIPCQGLRSGIPIYGRYVRALTRISLGIWGSLNS